MSHNDTIQDNPVQLNQHYEFDFDHPLETLWTLVSDTPRWGEASGLPRYQASEELQPDGSVKITGNLDIAGFSLAWEEPPVNWIEPVWFEQRRLFTREERGTLPCRQALALTPQSQQYCKTTSRSSVRCL
jgi:hypothetical protein